MVDFMQNRRAPLSSVFFRLSSLKVTVFLMVAFLVLTFWGVLSQAAVGDTAGGDRFFNHYFIWALGYIPLPAFKGLAVIASAHLLLAMIYRIPRKARSLGLYMMHIALLVLFVGSLAGSAFKQEYYGFRKVDGGTALSDRETAPQFYLRSDSLGLKPVEIPQNSWIYNVRSPGSVEVLPGKTVEIFTAEYNPCRAVPYVFMILMLVGVAVHYGLVVRKARKKPQMNGAGKVMLGIAVLGLMGMPSEASANFTPTTPVVYDGVVRPFDSFARGVLDDFSGKVTYKCAAGESPDCPRKMTATEVVAAIMSDAAIARDAAAGHENSAATWNLFKVLRSDVAAALSLPEDKRYVSFRELQRARGKLELYASRDDSDAATAEMKRLYSNSRMFELLQNPAANPLKIAEEPAGNSSAGISPFKAEVFYHNANPCLIAFIVALLGCLLSFVNLSVKSRKLDAAANICCGATAFVLLAILVARFLIASRPPFANLYEIILWVALFLESFLLGAFIWCKNRTFALIVPVSAMAAGLLFFAKFGLEAGDTFVPIPPVLNASIFLTIHVFTIALGFCGMILSGIVAHLLLYRRTCQPLSSLLYSTLVFGSVFTILGTCLGGVWADFSWGRFWGFDPKECGALFVSIWGMLLLHLRAGRLVKERTFALLACFNVVVTFLCWFGINLLGVGLHSYGFQNGTFLGLFAFVFVDVILILLLSCKKYE